MLMTIHIATVLFLGHNLQGTILYMFFSLFIKIHVLIYLRLSRTLFCERSLIHFCGDD